MAKIRRIEPNIPSLSGRKRVAAYARVSMETELLHHSLSAQVSHYSSLIQSNPEWEYAGVYADEGITGTSTKKRDEFNRLMKDCDAGKIDLVLVKSISRFARDTVDTLNATRHLKDLGIDVFFEREGIHSMSGEGELLLTLLASFAQAEAESISANEKWSVQKRFERGEPNTGILCFGYDWNPETKSLTINEEEGKWVKYIYEQYLGGASIKGLTLDLKEKGVRGKRGDLMGRTTLRRILSTETYVGDLLLQRYFSPEIHKPKLNEGEMEQILVSNAHEPLVSREDYAKVQERLNRRAKAAHNHGYEKTFFAGLVKCGKCGYACNHVLYHRQPADKAYIECNKRKTKECDLLPIRELELKGIMEQIAGCRENVERITLFDGHIDFLMKDGTVKSHIRKYSGDGFNKTPFSRKIFCGYCGSSIVRMGGNKRRTCWMCSVKKADKAGCEHELMSDGELYGAAQSILGTEENLDMEIYLQIEKTISYNDRIEFYMKEGGKKVYADGCKCKTPHINEDELKELFIKAANELFSEREEILANTKVMMEMVCETDSLDRDLQDSITELNIISEQMQIAIAENSRVALDQDEYEKRYAELTARYEKAKAKYDDIAEQIESKKAKRELFKGFIRTLEKQDGLMEDFDAGIWSSLVQEVIVKTKDDIRFIFKNGFEVRV